MYARAAVRQNPRQSQVKAFKAPVAGWIANRNLADPASNGLPQGAAILDNFMPRSTSAVLRRGSELYATLGDGTKVATSIFSYVVGNQRKLFASTDDTIYDITTITTAFNYVLGTDDGDTIETDGGDTFGEDSTIGKEVWEGATGGNWIVVQFATEGGIFLVGVNGESTGFIYDGTAFYPNISGGVWSLSYDGESANFTEGATLTGGTSAATATILKVTDNGTDGVLLLTGVSGAPFQDNEAITDGSGGTAVANGAETSVVPGITGVSSADLSFVWAYKNRLWFVEKDSLSAWYLDVDSIGGTATEFPLGGVFQRGGTLLFGATWSLDSGSQGGLSEQCIFVTTEGEVAVYQGSDPSSADSWQKVGVYRIGTPLGNKAFIRAGGDLVMGSSIGFVPLSQAIQRDFAALSPSAVSYPIEDAWNEAVALRAGTWQCEVWPETQMVVVAPAFSADIPSELFVANARTGAWSRFTGWDARCLHVFQGQLYFGSADGEIVKANVGGTDQSIPYTGVYLPLFEDFGAPASLKIAGLARPVMRTAYKPNVKVSFQGDFDFTMPSQPDAPIITGVSNVWGAAVWGDFVWGGTSAPLINQEWQSIGGTGYAVSVGLQVSSGAAIPLDAEIIRTEMTYQVAEVVT